MKVAIIGGGAAGMLCAIALKAKQNIDVTVYERMPKILKKIPATGNGRCNLTNENATAESYYEAAKFVAPAMEVYPPKRNILFFKTLGIPSVTEQEGRVYPMSRTAQSVVTALTLQAEKLGVKVKTITEIFSVQQDKNRFLLNRKFEADAVVFACGGAAAPEHGTDGSAYALLARLGHTILPISPALVSMCIKGFPKTLKGVRQICDAELRVADTIVHRELGEIQFAEYGVSGIPIMQMSRFVTEKNIKDAVVHLNCLPKLSKEDLHSFLHAEYGNAAAEDVISCLVPRALGNYIMQICNIRKDTEFQKIAKDKLSNLAEKLQSLDLKVDALRDFKYAQVTRGGASLSEFNPQTMESRLVRHIYAIGEVLDVDGPCGGYNLQWAWSSARLAADAIIKESIN